MLAHLGVLAARIRAYFRPGNSESDFDEEMASHLEMAEADARRRGLSEEDARRHARVQLGGVTQLRESWRASTGLAWLDGFALDARLGLRMLRRSWGLTLAGGLAMTIVITTAAVAFVFLDEFMGRTSPPLDEGDRIVALQNWDADARRRRAVSQRDVERWRETLTSVTDVGGFQTIEQRVQIEGRPAEWVRIAEMSASGFTLSRVPPLMGRWFAEDDEAAAAAPIVIISHDVWQSRFASSRAVVGETMKIGERAHTVVAVMPEGFAFPVNHRYWIPLRSNPGATLAPAPDGVVFARLAPGASLETAQAELAAVGLLPSPVDASAATASSAGGIRPRVVPYTFAFTDDVEPGELAWGQRIILFLVSLLLVPPCLNIAILIYARTVTRQEEFAARFALGASRARIVVQLCVEVLVLSTVAGAAALLLTRPILAQIGDIVRRFPALDGSLPFWVDFEFSWRAAVFVAGLSVMAALIAGLIPALRATGRVLPIALRSLNSRTRIPLGATWTTLIVAQVGLALAALPSTVELAWGHLRPAVLGPGFAAEDFLTARIEGVDADELRRRVEAEVGASAVTFAAALPGAEPTMAIDIEEGAGGARARHFVRANQVDRAFFDVFGIGAVAGRTFDGGDFGAAARTVVVDQTFVRRVLNDGNAIGRRVRPAVTAGAESGPWYEIVGVVPDRPANTSQGRMYVPAMHTAPTSLVTSTARAASGPAAAGPASAGPIHLALRAGPDPALTTRRLQDIVAGLGPSVRLDDVRRLDEMLAETQMTSSLTSYALAIVTMSVLVLSAAGLYALMSFTVAQRRREIGIRTALGARPTRLLAGIFARSMWQIGAGVAVGVTIALVLHEKLNIELEGGWHIPGVLPAAATFILLIGVFAAAGPARRATRVDPTEALRDG